MFNKGDVVVVKANVPSYYNFNVGDELIVIDGYTGAPRWLLVLTSGGKVRNIYGERIEKLKRYVNELNKKLYPNYVEFNGVLIQPELYNSYERFKEVK